MTRDRASEAGKTSRSPSSPAFLPLFTGDGLHRLLVRLRVERPGEPDLARRAAWGAVLTWLPLFLLTAIEGSWYRLAPDLANAVRDPGSQGMFVARRSFLLDLSAMAQFLGFIPFAFFAERFIDLKVQTAIVRLRAVADDHELIAAARAASRWARVGSSDVLLALLACAATWSWGSQEIANGLDSWHTSVTSLPGTAPVSERFTPAGAYALIVALPLFTYLWMRWVWKIGVWTSFLLRVSRMHLRVQAAHPDRTGGLGCLSDVQTSFSWILFGTGILFSAAMIHKLFFEGTPFSSLDVWGPMVVYVLLAPAVFLAPLFLFTRRLAQAKREALVLYGEMATALVTKFERRWFRGAERAPADMLESSDASVMADFKTAFEVVQDMRVVPFDRRSFLELFSAAASPLAPVAFFTQLPDKFKQVIDLFG